MNNDLLAGLIVQQLPALTPRWQRVLLQEFGTFRAILDDATPTEATEVPATVWYSLREYRRNRTLLEDASHTILGQCAEQNVSLLCCDQPTYPALLKEIADPPPLLYVRGNASLLELPQIGIVGSRNHTQGGARNARSFAAFLAQSGFAVTSGLALGIDTEAHLGALSVAEGKTIAVLGTGVDVIYPRRNAELYQRIIDNGGAIVSEFPLGTTAMPSYFPKRNRIISGLSLGVLVVEAALRSGSLITARTAMEQNREVFAIPGSIHSPLSKGCHQLIRQGATLVESGQDIVEQLGGGLAYLRDVATADAPTSHSERDPVLHYLADGWLSFDELIAYSGIAPAELAQRLTELELAGAVEQQQGRYLRV